MGVLQEISGLVKQAVQFSRDGKTFTLGDRENPTVVAQEWLRLHPQKGVSTHQMAMRILSANPGVSQKAFRSGGTYKMPSTVGGGTGKTRPRPAQTRNARPQAAGAAPVRPPAATVTAQANGGSYPYRLNNPGNMEYSANNPWPGQVGRGGRGRRFAMYDTPHHGLEAAIGRWMEVIRRRASRGEQTRIPDVVRVYSPEADGNDERQHSSNISQRSGIAADSILDADNVGQMADLSLGIAGAESGPRAQGFFTRQDSTNAVNNIAPVVLRRLAR